MDRAEEKPLVMPEPNLLPDLSGVTVLQIVPSLEAGGAERTAVDVAAALVKAGARALVATTGGRLVGELDAAGGVWVPFPAATKNPVEILWNAERLRRLSVREGVTLIHARSRAPAWSGLLAARRLGVPFVTTYHGAYKKGGWLKTWYNSVMVRGDAVIANSRFTADQMIEARHAQARDAQGRSKVTVIYRGTDLSKFDPDRISADRVAALRAEWGVPEGRRIVLLAARLTRWKGQEVLIDAAERLVQEGLSDVDFVLAGDPQGRSEYVAGLEARIAKAGLEDRVRIVGHCVDMPAADLAANVVTVPSIEPEAFGRSAAEAQAVGRPVVVSDLGAVPETVLAPPDVAEEARTGWRVPAGDPGALANAIRGALTLPDSERSALGDRARRHVRERFSLEAMTSATLQVYARLLARP